MPRIVSTTASRPRADGPPTTEKAASSAKYGEMSARALSESRYAPSDALSTPRLERAIGVVYVPQSERASHYFTAQLARQFDAAIFIDRSTAVRPLGP